MLCVASAYHWPGYGTPRIDRLLLRSMFVNSVNVMSESPSSSWLMNSLALDSSCGGAAARRRAACECVGRGVYECGEARVVGGRRRTCSLPNRRKRISMHSSMSIVPDISLSCIINSTTVKNRRGSHPVLSCRTR